jgi:tetratricopeptide (TPR) repeat protein
VLKEFEPALAGYDAASALAFRAALLMGLEEHEAALEVHRRRMAANIDDPRPIYDVARTERRVAEVALEGGATAAALAHLERAIEFGGRALATAERVAHRELEVSALVERARCRLDLELPAEAEQDLVRALELDPTRVDAQAWLAGARRSAAQTAAGAAAPPAVTVDPERRDDTPENATPVKPSGLKPIFDAFQKLLRPNESPAQNPVKPAGT